MLTVSHNGWRTFGPVITQILWVMVGGPTLNHSDVPGTNGLPSEIS